MAAIKLPDGSIKEVADGTTVAQVAEGIGRGLAKAAIAGKVDGKLVDLSHTLVGNHTVAIVTDRDPEALQVLRHSTAHVMAEAIQRLWPQAQLAYGPPLENGFYYDIALDVPISANDFERIEKEMQEIVKEDRPFTSYELSPEIGFEKLKEEGNKYKLDNANRAMKEGAERLSWYVTGRPTTQQLSGDAAFLWKGNQYFGNPDDIASGNVKQPFWEDLCRGPHVPSTQKIKAFKVMSVASSHWHGDVTSDRFQRIYGTAFFDQKQLDAHLKMLEEAKKRDHRVLGPQLGLFTIDDAVGQGLVLWKPKGAIVRQQLQDFISEHLRRQGYSQVFTPHIGRLGLYKTSGHYPYYKESQFPPLVDRGIGRATGQGGVLLLASYPTAWKRAKSMAICSSR